MPERRISLKIDNVISSMRKCVEYYDAVQERIQKLSPENVRESIKTSIIPEKKGGDTMKAGTVIAIVVAVVALLAAGAAAAVYFTKKHCLLCDDVDDDMYGDFPDEDEEAAPAPAAEEPAADAAAADAPAAEAEPEK